MKLKQKTSGIYFIEFEGPDQDGVLGRRRQSLDTRDKSDARRQVQLWMAGTHPKQLASVLAKPKSPVRTSMRSTGWTVTKALTACLDDKKVWCGKRSEGANRSNVKAFTLLCGEELLADMDYERVGQLIETQRDMGIAPGTIARRLASLSVAVAQSMIWKDPATGRPYLSGRPKWPTVTVENRRNRVISYTEEKAIFEAIEARRQSPSRQQWWHYAALTRLLLDTGLRMGEAMLLTDDMIQTTQVLDPRTGEARAMTFIELPEYLTKSKKARVVPVSDAILELRPMLVALSKNGKWFPWPVKATTPWVMWDAIRDDLKAKGMDLSDVVQHTYRHTCLTRLARGGMGINKLKEWAGHHDISVTDNRYGHLCKEDLLVGLDIQKENYRKSEILSRKNDYPVSLNSPANGVNHANNSTAH